MLRRHSAELNTKIVFSDALTTPKYLSTPGGPESRRLICLQQAEAAACGIS